ncbi:MAG: hypothetical protein NTW86_19915, partial [Candidatus Sumerlaeota bacterium]|nr:hypothetical protein [Candidatus Sumerlaeota bacterium]
TFYYWQLLLWEWYVASQALNLPEDLAVSKIDEFMNVAKQQRQAVFSWTGGDEKAEPTEWTAVTREYPPLEKPDNATANAITALRGMATQSLGGALAAPISPPAAGTFEAEVNAMYRIFQDCAYAVDAQDHDTHFGFISRLKDRQDARNRYAEWLHDRHSLVTDFVHDWAKKYNGQEFDVDGVEYLVTEYGEKEPNVGPNSRNLVIDKVVTPYDLLNDDGTLKRPLPLED